MSKEKVESTESTESTESKVTIKFTPENLDIIKKAAKELRGKKAIQDGGKADSNLSVASMEEQLKGWVLAIEELTEEKADISHQISNIYKEAKKLEYNVKAIKEIIKLRQLERMVRVEQMDAVKQYLEIIEGR